MAKDFEIKQSRNYKTINERTQQGTNMQELTDITKSITDAVAALRSKIEQAGFKVTMPGEVQDPTEQPGLKEPDIYKTQGIVPAFAQALQNAGFVALDPRATAQAQVVQVAAINTTPPERIPATPVELAEKEVARDLVGTPALTIIEGSEKYLALMAMIDNYIKDRDGFCKAAKATFPLYKTNDLRAWYGAQCKLRKAAGTWHKSHKPRPTTEEIVAQQANGLTATPEVKPEPEKVNGYAPVPVPVAAATLPTFDEQVQSLRKAEVDKAMNGALGKIEGQVAQDAAGNKHNSLVQLARTTARALGANGPISVDEVTSAMSATSNVMPVAGKIHKWKGKIFNKSEWVWIGTKATSMASSHARHVGVWALKTWLKDNTLNGTAASVSSYNLFGIYKDMSRLNTTRIKVEASKFTWFVGDESLSPELRATITKDNNCLYGIPVSFIPGAVGAMLLPPDPSKNMARAEK